MKVFSRWKYTAY